jgi:type I restriction enzyme S subunit
MNWDMKDNWIETSLGKICSINGRIGYRGYTVKDIVGQDEGAITVSPSNIKKSKLSFDKVTYISWFKYDESPEIKLNIDDILLVKTGSTYGKTAQVKELRTPATINPQIVVLKKITINSIYLAYLMQDNIIQKQIEATVVGGAIPTLSQESISNFNVNLPPLPQQQKIAKILSTVDNVIEKTESAIAKYQAIKQGLMHDLFTRGIDVNTGKLRPIPQDAPELYKESALGLIPKDWEVGSLEEIAYLQGGFAFSSSFASEKGVRWLKIANVGFNKIKWNDKSYLPLNFIEQYSSFVLKENDLVMAMTRPIIRKSLKVSSITSNDLPSILNQRVGRFVISNIENTNFVKYLMQYREIISQIELEILGTDPPNVSSNQINSLKIKKPLEDEMYQIGLRVEKIDNKIQTEQQALAKYQQVKAGLLQDLLTGKVEVRID